MPASFYLRRVKKIKTVFAFLRYWIHASTKHDIHSPFVFELLTKVIENQKKEPVFSDIEDLRKKLLSSEKEIEVEDLGAGSTAFKGNKRRLSQIARHALKSPKYAQLLYRLVAHFKPSEILELGTSFGISTLYLSAGNSQAKTTTLEGSPAIASIAKENFRAWNNPNIRLVEGNFDTSLPEYLQSGGKPDFVFFDGNHCKGPTLSYFKQCLRSKREDSVFIFDDIHWSDEMNEAWEEIKNHQEVTCTLDLYQLGLVFFRSGQEKQHFTVRF